MRPLDSVGKHLKGQHDQRTHAGGGAGGASSASSSPSSEATPSLDGVPFRSDYINDINYEMYEPNPPAVLYHVAPKGARDDIAANGLNPAYRTWNTGASMGGEYRDEHLWTTGDDGEEFAYEYRPEGIYMFSDLGRAKQYAAGNKGDIYQIDTDVNSREIIRDPSQATNWEYEDPTEHAFVTRYVEPAALTRLDVGKNLGEPIFKHGDHSDPDHDLGIPRREMPQVDMPEFRGLLRRRGIRSFRRRYDPADLRRSQDGLNAEKVRQIASGGKPMGTIIVSRDRHILDGHHRWAAAAVRGVKVTALVVDLGIEDLIDLVESSGVEKSMTVAFAPGLVPRLTHNSGIIKHLSGKHDQSDHGRRGSGAGTREALTARAEQLESEGRGAAAAVYRLRLHTDGPGGVRAFTRGESDSASLPVRDGQRQQVATKAVHELTPDARAILRAGGISTPVVHELDAENGGAEFFHAAISRSKEGNPYASSVFVYEPEEYRGMRLFVSEDGQSGIALKGDEIVSLFKTGTSGDREVARPLMELAIQEGGRRGDCFDTVLPKIYAEHGLEVRHRVGWNDEYAPEGWDKRLYQRWNNGEPDVTFFRYNRDYTDEYRPGLGSLVDSYDDAVALTQAAVLKHLKRKHDQKTHGGDGAAALPSGWTEYEARAVDEMQPDGTFVTHPRRTFGGPNQTVVTVTGTDIPASRVNQILTDVTTLQGIAPVENLKVDVGDGPFAQQGFSDTVYGFVPVGQSRIFLRPEARPFVDPGFNMPVLADDPGRYTLVHEYGHVLDRRSAEKAAEDKSIVIASHQTGMSRYAFAEESVQPGREAFAEAFVGWVGSQGTFASDGPSGKAFVRYFANKYGWDSGGPGRPPSAGFAKQASGGSGLLIADTFSAEGPKQVMPRSPVAKHGDPSRPGYAQLHPNSGTGKYADWGDHAGRIAEAASRGPDAEGLSFIAAGETYYTDEEALAAFKEVYDYRHVGINADGQEVVLQSEVLSVATAEGVGTYVEGHIKDGQGRQVGTFERVFTVDSNGVPVVEHVLLELVPSAQGLGFATEFNARAEDYYVSHGVGSITLHAALDKGGYAWASAGYAFDTRRSKLTYTRETLAARLKDADSFVPGIGNVEELRDLGRRLMLSPDSAEFPTPFEISRVGYTDGAETWPGKQILLGSDWYGEKVLTPAGRRMSATEAANKSVLIRFAPGLQPTLKHLKGKHDQSTHGSGGAGLAQSRAEREVDYLLRQGDSWLDEQLARGRVVLPPPPGVLERLDDARRKVRRWVEERRNPPVEKLSHREVLELVRINRARADAEREAQGLPPIDWPPYPDPVSKADVDALKVLGRVFDGVVDDRLLRVLGLLGPLDRVGEPWSDLLGDMIEGALSGLPEDVFKHLKGQHDQSTHGGGGSNQSANAVGDLSAFADEIDESLEGSLSANAEESRASWVYDSKWPKAYLDEAASDIEYQGMLHSNMRRMGWGETVTIVRRGKPAGTGIVNGSLDPSWQGRGYGQDDSLNVYQVPLTNIVGVGHPNESEVFFRPSGTASASVAKHLKDKHDQQTHAGSGGGYAAGGEEFQRDQESWFNAMLEERQGGDSPLLTEGQMRLPVNERLKAAVAARLAERMSDVPADRMMEAAFAGGRSDYEHPQMEVSRKAMQPGSWVAILDPSSRVRRLADVGDLMVLNGTREGLGDGWVRSGTPEAAAKVRQVAASRMVRMWAASSNDDNIVSLAVQDAAAAEFSMEGHAPWPARDDVGRFARQRADAMTASHGDVYRSFVRAQYDETQAMFKEMGIGSVRVHRGVVVEESVMRDAFDVSGTQLTGGARLRPLSSWSSDRAEAQSFAMDAIPRQEAQFRVVMETRLPVSQILSTPYTGVGCRAEGEVVSVTPTVDAAITILGKLG